jgi:hypothetical protein
MWANREIARVERKPVAADGFIEKTHTCVPEFYSLHDLSNLG